jgi:hypothetical protein
MYRESPCMTLVNYKSFLLHRCLGHDINCLEANRMLVLNLLAREGKYDDAAGSLSDIVQLLDRFEPRNHTLYYDMSLAFARLVYMHGKCNRINFS